MTALLFIRLMGSLHSFPTPYGYVDVYLTLNLETGLRASCCLPVDVSSIRVFMVVGSCGFDSWLMRLSLLWFFATLWWYHNYLFVWMNGFIRDLWALPCLAIDGLHDFDPERLTGDGTALGASLKGEPSASLLQLIYSLDSLWKS